MTINFLLTSFDNLIIYTIQKGNGWDDSSRNRVRPETTIEDLTLLSLSFRWSRAPSTGPPDPTGTLTPETLGRTPKRRLNDTPEVGQRFVEIKRTYSLVLFMD